MIYSHVRYCTWLLKSSHCTENMIGGHFAIKTNKIHSFTGTCTLVCINLILATLKEKGGAGRWYYGLPLMCQI